MDFKFWERKNEKEKKPQVVEEKESTPEVRTVLVEGKPMVIDDEPAPRAEKTVAPLEEEAARVVEEEAAPVEEKTAPVEEKTAPVEEEKAAPVVEEKSAPVVEEKSAPVVEEKPAPVVEEKAAPVEERTPSVDTSALLSTLHALSQKIDIIHRSNEQRQRDLMAQQKELSAQLEDKENIIKQQHNQLLKFQDDVIYKTQHGLIMELIGLADNVRTILTKQQEQKDYDDLLDDVTRLGQWIDATLEENGVRKFEEAATQEYNPKRQAIIETQSAPQPELSGTYVTDQPGYEWTMPYVVIRSDVQLQNFMAENKVPKKFSYVIRQEEVIKLK